MDQTLVELILRLVESAKPTGSDHSIEVGKCYLIRTVTMTHTGRVKAVTASDIVLEDAAWIAETARFHTTLSTGELNEVEPFVNDCIVSRASIVDMTEWQHPLPREQQ